MSMENNRIREYKSHNTSNVVYNVVEELQDYMFTNKNLIEFNKDNFNLDVIDKCDTNAIVNYKNNATNDKYINDKKNTNVKKNEITENIYKPRQADSLFWCFYILKYGYSKYEMEIGNQHFTIEKTEKFKYIENLRKKKDILKINKIRPLSDLEDDLAHNPRISIKTFFALCIIEKLNILLVDKRKMYESINNDDSEIHVIHRNSVSFEHYIELNVTPTKLSNFRETFYKVNGFDNSLKSMSAYKVDELLELCKKLDINVHPNNADGKKKMGKKDIYELLVQNF
jgi:hypothetical protein